MRPRLLHLGSFSLFGKSGHELKRFNEAEAFTPRIHVDKLWASIESIQSFNEAEAFTPRIPHSGLTFESVENAASMRPRLLHLGSFSSPIPDLSLGSRFNEAEAFTPRILYRWAAKAADFLARASMRPRLLHLGSLPRQGEPT